jgi:hypothetical protein
LFIKLLYHPKTSTVYKASSAREYLILHVYGKTGRKVLLLRRAAPSHSITSYLGGGGSLNLTNSVVVRIRKGKEISINIPFDYIYLS